MAPFVSQLKFRTLNKREIVFTEGSPRTYVYFIHSGCVKTYKTDADGNRLPKGGVISSQRLIRTTPLFGHSRSHPTDGAVGSAGSRL
ncbi:cyclic nucleotide-binding domain-containing protein [Polycladomyces subterraneus]|uniref:cyclic nucleotide-binding domain-containing protein n=1 Tax=Polycladomyces subterraneus TaxID=1016997 RepID=UPI00344A390A